MYSRHLSSAVEQRFCKAKVPGPNPGGGSKKIITPDLVGNLPAYQSTDGSPPEFTLDLIEGGGDRIRILF